MGESKRSNPEAPIRAAEKLRAKEATIPLALKSDKVWVDGEFVPWEEAQIHVLTHSLHYGVAIFEGIRAYKTAAGRTAVFRLAEHVRRFFESAHMVVMDIPFSRDEVSRACVETVRANKFDACYIRPLGYYDAGAMGLGALNKVRVAICVWDWGAYLGEKGLKEGIRAKVSSHNRMHVAAYMTKGKICGQYVNSVLAKREAVLAGYDEAILLDNQGYICEASGENIFMIRDRVIRTPPLSSPILPGITRDSIITLARDLGFEVREELFTRDSLYCADEVFFTGTAAEVTPVREVDSRRIGEGKPGKVTRQLQEAFFKTVRGENPQHESWLTYV
jgi:branched-chain amino acid aminotransferase